MSERIILGIKKSAKNNPSLGLISAILEVTDEKLSLITTENFCPTKEVFILTGYGEIEEKFKENELFKIPVQPNEYQSGSCTYKAIGSDAQKLQPNDFAEVIDAKLPNRNDRILVLSEPPVTKYIFVQSDDGNCYGPFDWTSKGVAYGEVEIELKIITGGGLGKLLGGRYQIGKIPAAKVNSNAVEFNNLYHKVKIVKNISLIVSGAELEEFASDKEIIEEIRRIAGESAGKIIDRKTIDTLVSFAKKNKEASYPINKSRINIFNKIVEFNEEILNEINQLIEIYLKNPAGEIVLKKYIEDNREKYIGKLKKEKEKEIDEETKKRQDELSNIRNDIENLHKEKNNLKNEIEDQHKLFKKNLLIDQNAHIEKVLKEHQEKIAEMSAIEAAAEDKIASIQARVGNLTEIDDIQKLVIKKQSILEYIQQQIEEKKKDRDALLEESVKAEDVIRKKLRSMKPYVDYLNGTFSEKKFNQLNIKVDCIDLSYSSHLSHLSNKEKSIAQQAIIHSVKMRLNQLGRCIDDQQVANLLISIQQSFITFFAGLPGVGKTSLCKLMAQVQGIDKRLLSVSVARGWTSTKDMVGFHNPLNDKFQPASTGMYEFLHAINAEVMAGGSNPMSYILLDEANLSSIEHYWSTFMGITDATTSQTLVIGQESLIIPRNLRFLATINYDGTTEPLSPRILDRAGVIVMHPEDVVSRQWVDESILQALPISSVEMDALFGLFSDAPELEQEEKSALNAVLDVLRDSTGDKGRNLHISQRKINSIRQYCGRAGPIMSSDKKELIALDWAIMQHVLPQVTGHGIKFGNRLLALKNCLETHGLEKSAEYLNQMILSGQNNLHSYEFFCW